MTSRPDTRLPVFCLSSSTKAVTERLPPLRIKSRANNAPASPAPTIKVFNLTSLLSLGVCSTRHETRRPPLNNIPEKNVTANDDLGNSEKRHTKFNNKNAIKPEIYNFAKII